MPGILEEIGVSESCLACSFGLFLFFLRFTPTAFSGNLNPGGDPLPLPISKSSMSSISLIDCFLSPGKLQQQWLSERFMSERKRVKLVCQIWARVDPESYQIGLLRPILKVILILRLCLSFLKYFLF